MAFACPQRVSCFSRASAGLLLALLASTLSPGCEATPPDNDNPVGPKGDAGGTNFVDTILNYRQDGNVVSCGESIPLLCQEQTGVCAGHPMLGPPDGASHPLGIQGTIEVGFLCEPIVEIPAEDGMLISEFRIWATVPAGQRAIVSVSSDGSNYIRLAEMTMSDQRFDISNQDTDFVRFVQISSEVANDITIDAIEALR